MTVSLRRIASLTTCAVLLGTLTGSAYGAQAPGGDVSHTVSPAARAVTRVILRIDSCRRCPAYLQQALEDGTYWNSNIHRVRRGVVRFEVPTRRTHGMTFVLNPRWANATNAVTNIVTRYAHTEAGQRITNRVARQKNRATACWRGTSQRRVVLDVRAVRFAAPAFGGGQGYALRAWFNPLRRSIPPMQQTWRGTLGNQDAYICRP